MKIIELDEVDSTNEYCKRNYAGRSFAVTAERQTGGRGTKGRSFSSEKGGLYISVVRNLYKMQATDAFLIMVNACTAVCRTVEHYGLKPVIRWANDVLVNDKKICGTLIENTFSGSFVSRSIVGIGLNINNELPEELLPIATTIKMETGKEISVSEVRDILLENMNKKFTLTDDKSYIDWLGKQVTVTTAEGEHTATAVDVDTDGRLICVIAGSLKKISSAEVSLKL